MPLCRATFLSLLLVLPHHIFAQETLNEVRRQIQAVQRETAKEKELHQAENKRHTQFKENQQEKRRNIENQSQLLRSQMDSLRVEKESLAESARRANGQARLFQQRRERYQRELALYLDTLAKKLEADFPYKATESAVSLRESSAQLSSGIIGPEEALGRTLDLLLDRLQLGYGVEIWSGFHRDGARSIAGKFFRYGAIAAIFVSQDGNEVFFLHGNPHQGYKWEAVFDFNRRALLKETLKVAEGKAAPRLVSLPFARPSLTGGEK